MTAPKKNEGKKTKHHVGPWVGLAGTAIILVLLSVFVLGS